MRLLDKRFAPFIAVTLVFVTLAAACGGGSGSQAGSPSPLNELALLPGNLPKSCSSFFLYDPAAMKEDFAQLPGYYDKMDKNPFLTSDRGFIRAFTEENLPYRDIGTRVVRLLFIDWTEHLAPTPGPRDELGLFGYEFESVDHAVETASFLSPSHRTKTVYRESNIVTELWRDNSIKDDCFADMGERIRMILKES